MALVSVSKAKARLGVSAQSVRRFISAGELVAEKSDTDRWLVDEDSLEALVLSRKTQHSKALIATRNATNVAVNSGVRAVKPTPQAPISSPKFAQVKDISRFRDIIKGALAEDGEDQLYQNVSAQRLVWLFQNNLFEFSDPWKFTVEGSTDWSNYLHRVFIQRETAGELAQYDAETISYLISDPDQIYHDQIPTQVLLNRAQDDICEHDHERQWVRVIVKRFISVSYDGALVARSASEDVPVILLARKREW